MMKITFLVTAFFVSSFCSGQICDKIDVGDFERIWCMPNFTFGKSFLLKSGFHLLTAVNENKIFKFEKRNKNGTVDINVKCLLENQIFEFSIHTTDQEQIKQMFVSLESLGYKKTENESTNLQPGHFIYSKTVQFIGPTLKFVFSGIYNKADTKLEGNFTIEFGG